MDRDFAFSNVNQNQIEAISLNDELVQERLNKVRDDLIAGQKISKIKVIGYTDAAHFIRTHFLKPYYHEQNKKNERRTND